MATFDFDFQRYIARRKGAREAQVREGAAYAFPGDSRLLRSLGKLRPVELALEEAGRLLKEHAKVEILSTAVRATPERHAEAFQAARACAQALHIDAPTVYVTPQPLGAGVRTLGTAEEAYIVLPGAALSSFNERELMDLLGRECGRVQNGHAPYLTALYYLDHAASTVVRWAVSPARSTLQSWARRAQVTADRAGLLCSRSLDISLAALRRAAGPGDPLPVERRERALTRFAGSQYFRRAAGAGEGGEPADSCDGAVAQMLDEKDGES